MNRIQLLLSAIGISLVTAAVISVPRHYSFNADYVKFRNEYAKEEAQEYKGAAAYYRKITANQITGEINYKDVQAAREKANVMFNSSFKKSRAFDNMKWGETGPDNVGGRTRVVISDKNNADKLYMGAVGGGFWMSTDNGNTWSKRSGNDSSSAIAVSSIAQAANGDIYYGTGEGIGGFSGISSFTGQLFQLGEGIFKSTDGGATFTQLASTKPSNSNSATDAWSYVNKIVADPINPAKLFAATYGGFKVTLDGGATWAKPASLNTTTHFLDVEISADGNRVVASTSNNLYVSNDGGTTFSSNKMGTNGLPASGTAGRIDLAIAPNDGNYVYASVAATNSSLKGIYKSTDGGATWTTIAVGGSAIFDPLSSPAQSQGIYDMGISVHPTNKDMVFLAGCLDLVRYTPSTGWVSIAYANNGNPSRYVHADMHYISFNSANPETMYVTCDGGFYRTFNCSAASPDFAEKNKNYAVTQCYGIGANYLGNVVYGTQDNGTGLIGTSANSPMASRDLTGGDGTRCAMSDYLPNYVFTSIVTGQLLRSANGIQSNASFKSMFDKNVDLNTNGASGTDQDQLPDDGAEWVAPISYKEKKVGTAIKSVYLFGSNTSVWVTQGALSGGTPVWFKLFNTGNVGFSAITMSKDGKTVFAATQGGAVYRIKVPSLWDSTYRYTDTITNMPPKVGTSAGPYTYPLYSSCQTTSIGSFGRYVTDLSCDSTGDVLLVTLGNFSNTSYIYKATDAISAATPTFTDITANLPKMPLYTSLCLNGSPSKFMIGSELGVWGTDNGGSSWVELNMMNADQTTWHPRVATYEIIEKDVYRELSGGQYNGTVVYSGTHGRGTFRSTSLAYYSPSAPAGYQDASERVNSIKLYPNPATNQTTIEYVAEKSAKISIRVYSLTGTLVKEEWINATEGANSITLNIANLAAGGYVVTMNDNGKRAATSLIKR